MINIDAVFNNVRVLFINMIICNIVKMLGLQSTLALLSLIENMDIENLKQILADIKKGMDCPDNPLNKLLEGLTFITKFLNAPTDAISDLIFPFTSFFGIEDKKESESSPCTKK